MSSTYYLSSLASDTYGLQLLTAVESSETPITFQATRNTWTAHGGTTNPNVPNNNDWQTGSMTVKIKITTANANISMRVIAYRLNSVGGVLEASVRTAAQTLSTTGTYTFVIPSTDWAAGNITDRLGFDYEIYTTKNGQSIVMSVGSVDTSIATSIVHYLNPSVSSSAATSIITSSATLNGNLSALGSATTVDRFFEWRAVGAGTWNTTTKNAQTTTGTFSQSISGLASNTQYEFRAVAEYANGGTQRVEGSTLTFWTLTFTAPSVSSSAATSIAETSATLNANLTALGDTTTTEAFFQYRLVGAPTWIDTTKVTKTTTGTYSQGLTGLTSNSNYEFRAAIEYVDGTTKYVYGSTLTFDTLAYYYTLDITKSGNGSVKVGGTTVTLPYSEQHIQDSVVALEAVPDQYNEFVKWVVNDVDVFTASTNVTMTAARTVVVYFQGQSATIIEKLDYPSSDFIYVGGIVQNSITTRKRSSTDGSGTGGWTANHGDTVNAIAVDGDGNVYTGGNEGDGYKARKYDSNGTLIWSLNLADDQVYMNVSAIAVDRQQNVYIAGTVLDVGDTVQKISSSGVVIWGLIYNFSAAARAIAVDIDGNVYVGGDAASGITFRKYNSSGTLQFSKGTADGINLTSVRGVAVDLSNNIYICGVPTIAGTSHDVYKLNADGTTAWSAMHGAQVNAIAVDPQGNVYVGGVPSNDIVIRKYNSSGVEQLLPNQVDGDINYAFEIHTECYGIALDTLTNILIICHEGASNITLGKYDSSGKCIWYIGWGSFYAIAADPGLYGAGFWQEEFIQMDTVDNSTYEYTDVGPFDPLEENTYRVTRMVDGAVDAAPVLSGAEGGFLYTPSNIGLSWTTTTAAAGPSNEVSITYADTDRWLVDRIEGGDEGATYVSNITVPEYDREARSAIRTIAFLSGTKVLLCASDSMARPYLTELIIYDSATNTSALIPYVLSEYSEVHSAALSPDGTKLVLGGSFTGYAKIYSVSGTTVTFVSNIYADTGTTALNSTVQAAAFSPDGTKLVLGGYFTGYAKIYSVSGTTVTFVSNIYADTGTTALNSTVITAALSPDGTKLVLGGMFAGYAKIYSVSGTTVTFVSNIYTDTGTTALSSYVQTVALSPDGTKLVLGGAFAGYAKIYSVSGTTVTFVSNIYADTGTTALNNAVLQAAFSPDGAKLVLGGAFTGYAKIYSVSGTTVTFVSNIYADTGTTALNSTVITAAFSPDGIKLVLGGYFTGWAKIYSVSGTTVTFVSNIYADTETTALSSYVQTVALSPDGTKLVLGGEFTGRAKIYSVSGTTVTFVSNIYADTGTTALSDYVLTSALSPDGTKLVLGGAFAGYAKIYSVSGTTVTFVSNIYADTGTTALDNAVYVAAFSPDGTELVLGGSFTGRAKIYSVSGTTVTFVSNIYADTGTTALSSYVQTVALSPDGTKLVLGGGFTGRAKIYSVSGTTVTFVSNIYADTGTTALNSGVLTSAFPPDGTKLVLGGEFTGRAKIYSVSGTTVTFVSNIYADTGTTALSSYVLTSALSPDGTKLVLSGYFTGRAKIYSVSGTTVTFVSDIYADTGTTALGGMVSAAVFSPDGNALVLGGDFINFANIYLHLFFSRYAYALDPATTYSDTGPFTNNVEYCYRIALYDGAMSDWSNTSCVTYIEIVTGPGITIISTSLSRISTIAGLNVCEVTFESTQALVEWEAREDGTGNGTGALVGYGTTLAANTEATFEVWYDELTQGDKVYRINIYGKNAANEWTPYAV